MTLVLSFLLGVAWAATLFAVGHLVSKKWSDARWARSLAPLVAGTVPSIYMAISIGHPEFSARLATWLGTGAVALVYGVIRPALRSAKNK